jgi:4-amino-4-deoxy-L-arabinose transferase-like glycosyltransferase
MQKRRAPIWLAAWLIALTCLLSGLPAIGLVGPDEPRYAAVARTMAESGDWLTPRLNGVPWFEKPVLYYWAAGIAFRLLGPSDWAARLPSALAAVMTTALLTWLCGRLWGPLSATDFVLLFPATLGIWAFAHAATMDMLFTAALAAAMVAAFWAVGETAPASPASRLWRAATGAALGVAVLAKGPAGIILAGGSVLAWAAMTKSWRCALQFFGWECISSFAAVALPWYVACTLAHPEFARTFLWEHNVVRYLKPVFAHVQPWWFFGPVLLLGMFPWSALLVLIPLWPRRTPVRIPPASTPELFFACWTLFPVVFFSFSQSKLPGYVLPALPPLAILLTRMLARSPRRKLGYGLAGVGLSWTLIALTARIWLKRLPADWVHEFHVTIITILVSVALLGVGLALMALAGRHRAALWGNALLTAALIAATSISFLPRLDPELSARTLAGALARQSTVAELRLYEVPRAWQYGLEFYLHRPLLPWEPQLQAPAWICLPASRLPVLARRAELLSAPQPLPGHFVLVRVRGL